MKSTTIHIGLGSNLGDRLAHLQRAILILSTTPGVEILNVSSVYESAALVLPGRAPQPDYLNAVIACRSSLQPMEMLHVCLVTEKRLGRTRSPQVKWEARTIDLDLLLWSNIVFSNEILTIPHPRLADRPFVLLPLSEIDIDLKIPAPFDCTVRYLLSTYSPTSPALRTSLVLTIPPSLNEPIR